MNNRVMLVEDDGNLAASLLSFLEREGFEVNHKHDLESAQEACKEDSWDLMVLDWMLPDGQGIDLLKKIRMEKNLKPVILLTARTDLIDKIIGLETGANDYLTKPFEPRELLARMRVQLREERPAQTEEGAASQLNFEGIQMDLNTFEVTYQNGWLETRSFQSKFYH